MQEALDLFLYESRVDAALYLNGVKLGNKALNPGKHVRNLESDGETQIAAVRQGLGITTLPCFIGDADPLLVRVPGTDLHLYGTLWLLTQRETRKTKRVQLFTEFTSRRLAAYAPLLAGLSISPD